MGIGRPEMKRMMAGILLFAAVAAMGAEEPLPRVYRCWESFHKEDGLPADKVFSILVDGDRIWAGTDNGLACYENGKWRSYGVKDGLAHPAVLSLALDPSSGVIWAGTMKGLSRFSAGRF